MTTALILTATTAVGHAKDSSSALPLAPTQGSAKQAGQQSSLELLSVMPPKKVRETIVAGAQQLKANLALLDEEATWADYLQVGQLLQFASDRLPSPLNAESRRQVQAILVIYDSVSKNDAYRAITMLDSFHTIHAGLVALLNPTYANDRDRLIQSSYLLSQTAAELGAGWKGILAMPRDLVTPDLLTGKNLELAIKQLRDMQKRYEIVAADQKYAMVAAIPTFKITQANLEQYLNRLVKIAAISD